MNGEDPKHRKTFRIRPEQVWNVQGMIQQLVMLLIMLAVYTVIRFLTQDPEGGYAGLERWLQQFHGLFRTPHLFSDLLTGALAGAALAGMFLLLDGAVGYIRDREKLNEWIHRSDFMLPENRRQRKWALSIALSGSAIEEILFRGFIFLAVVNLWGSWIWASLIISAVFGFLHAGLQGFWSTLWIFMISFLLCYFTVLGKSIYFLVAVHMMVNIMNLFLLPVLADRLSPPSR